MSFTDYLLVTADGETLGSSSISAARAPSAATAGSFTAQRRAAGTHRDEPAGYVHLTATKAALGKDDGSPPRCRGRMGPVAAPCRRGARRMLQGRHRPLVFCARQAPPSNGRALPPWKRFSRPCEKSSAASVRNAQPGARAHWTRCAPSSRRPGGCSPPLAPTGRKPS